ncbi:MAG: DUF4314 domain-containing protein [Oscillospiraceae bacterium]
MNIMDVKRLRELYPVGTRIMLDYMEDIQAVPTGTKGIVDHIDDMGTIHMKWDNGSNLGICPDADRFHVIGKAGK